MTRSRRTRRQSWSVATRLTLWYAASAFGLILMVSALSYWGLVRSLDQADDRLLADKVRVIRAVLLNRPHDDQVLRQEVEEAWEARRDTQVYVRVVDADRRVMAETPEMGRVLPSTAFGPAEESEQAYDYASDTRTFRVLAARLVSDDRVESPVIVQVGTDRSGEFALLASYRRYLLVALVGGLILSSVIAHQIARRGMRPVHDITDTARRIRATNLHERLAVEGLPDELLALAGTFNQMLERLEESFARISRFSADIAHELRTPLNNLLGEAEVALSRPRSPDDYREVLGSLLEDCRRLARLTDDMLFLARTEAPGASLTTEPLALGSELRTIVDFYEAAADDAGVRLVVDAEPDVVVEANRLLLQRAVTNLVANALAHTPSGGSITLRASRSDAAAAVDVIDTGCGIAVEHLPHVFDRFYRVDAVRRGGEAGHVGLGLSLVKGIVDFHRGTVRIESVPGAGTRVTLDFPRRLRDREPGHVERDKGTLPLDIPA